MRVNSQLTIKVMLQIRLLGQKLNILVRVGGGLSPKYNGVDFLSLLSSKILIIADFLNEY